MISPAAVALHCIAALSMALAIFAQMMLRRDRGGLYRYIPLLPLALSVNAFGTALLTDAHDIAVGELAQRLQLVGHGLGLLFCVDFQQRATADEHPAQRAFLRMLCFACLSCAAAGFMVIPDRPAAPALMVLPGARLYPEPALSTIGYVTYLVAASLIARSVYKAFKLAPHYATAPIRFALPILLAAVAHDLLMRFRIIESTYLLGYASAVYLLSASTGRAHRYVRQGKALRERSEDLENSYEQLTTARDALVQKRRLAAIGELSAVLAHEVRNPLAVIKNAAASLRRGASLPEVTRRHLLEIADEETSRLVRLVDDMLTYAKPLRLELSAHCPGTLIEAAIAATSAEPGMPGDSATVAVQHCEDLRFVADGRLVALALANLLSNAVRASSAGDTVTISVQRGASGRDAAPEVRFQVHDQGAGMDDTVRRKALDPFFTTRPRGIGLGLAIADQIAQAHRGRLELSSRSGEGATVVLVLPLAHPS